MTIAEWLTTSHGILARAGITSPRLDSELILAHTLRKSRPFLHAHPDDELSLREREISDARLQLRLDRTPIAYIVGHKEFYGRSFRVTPSTLIPRPESEDIITLLLDEVGRHALRSGITPKLVDVGTGSGCLGITAKLELPAIDVTLIDASQHALTIAEINAKRLGAEVALLRSDLLNRYPYQANYLLANLPYVDETWDVSPETIHEPKEALFAPAGGLGLINRLLDETPAKLMPDGIIILEADPRQHTAVTQKAEMLGFHVTAQQGFILRLQRG